MADNYIARRNSALRARWAAKYRAALEQGKTWPDAWGPINRMYFERRLRELRLDARQWLAGLEGRKRAEAIARERWFKRRTWHAHTP